MTAANDVIGFFPAVYTIYLHPIGRLIGILFVSQKVMFQPEENGFIDVRDVMPGTIDLIALHNGYNLVVCLILVYHSESTYGNGLYQYAATGYYFLGEHNDIQRILITYYSGASCFVHTKPAHLYVAESLRHKAV